MLAEQLSRRSYDQVEASAGVLAHRGCWSRLEDKNSLVALTTGLDRGYGLETDVRDWDGKLVVSHDPPGRGALLLETLFEHYQSIGSTACLALNVKSDGLAEEMCRLIEKHTIENYFVFDMSIPDTLSYLRCGLRVYTRQSEFETQASLYEECEGVWLDAFRDDWYSQDTLIQHIDNGKQVAVVSPELHGRCHEKVWQLVRGLPEKYTQKTFICTDLPESFEESK